MVVSGIKEHLSQLTEYIKVVLILLFCVITQCFRAQSIDAFVNNTVTKLKAEGNTQIIISLDYCSACEGYYDCFIFYRKDTNAAMLRYIRYEDSYQKMNILTELLITDRNIDPIFQILDQEKDSIFFQNAHLESLLAKRVLENGQIFYESSPLHGYFHLLEIYDHSMEVQSNLSMVDLNESYKKAYYYWLLNSFIRNYYIDYVLEKTEKKDLKRERKNH